MIRDGRELIIAGHSRWLDGIVGVEGRVTVGGSGGRNCCGSSGAVGGA